MKNFGGSIWLSSLKAMGYRGSWTRGALMTFPATWFGCFFFYTFLTKSQVLVLCFIPLDHGGRDLTKT